MTILDPTGPAPRFLAQYAKRHHAGAFATPTAKELEAHPERLADLRHGDERTVIVTSTLTRESRRTDFTGSEYRLPGGARVATHIARTPDAPIPDFSGHDFVMAYAEDRPLHAGLAAQGRVITASRVTAAAEVINCWGPPGTERRYTPADRATVTRILGVQVPEPSRAAIAAEVQSVTGWDDDFPYYSDGSWSALSLRGFYPDEPGRGVKPSEMPKSWKAENPADLDRTCEWTTLAERCPSILQFVESVPWWGRMERVRLLRMTAGGSLGRHSDISDRDSGTRDGQITRFHVPLVTHPDTLLHSWDLDGTHRADHLAAWSCYYLDARKPHAVDNGPVDRVHLVVDLMTDADARREIAASWRAA